MLSSADAELVRHDPTLPGLRIVLDPEVLTDILCKGLPDHDLGAATCTYLRYKPGTSCLAAYRVVAGGQLIDLYLKAYRPESLEKLEKAARPARAAGPLGVGRIVHNELGLVVSLFPNDRHLHAISRLEDPALRKRLLRELLPNRPSLWKGETETLRYKPERRYVARLRTQEGEQAVLKFYADADFTQFARHPFRSEGPLRVARLLGHSRRRCAVAWEWLPGRSLSDAITDAVLPIESVKQTGAALAALHAQPGDGLRRLSRTAEAATLRAVAQGLVVLCPALAERIDEITRRLTSNIENKPPAIRPIHGDFYAHQVLVPESGVCVVDFDEAILGDPAADLGNFLAHLERAVLIGELSSGRRDQIRNGLLEEYEPRVESSYLDLHTASALFRLASAPFRNREPDWPDRVERILAQTESLLSSSRPRIKSPSAAQRSASRSIPVVDPYHVTRDPQMSFLTAALDPRQMQRELEPCLAQISNESGSMVLRAIRVTRHKLGRRCLIEYDLQPSYGDGTVQPLTLVGKVRAKGLDTSTHKLQQTLWKSGFDDQSEDGISIPQPVGAIPDLRMWLQRKISGAAAARLLTGPDGVALSPRIAEAIHKLHQAGIPSDRRHTMADELRILHERLATVAQLQPTWSVRIERILAACDGLASSVPEEPCCGIHRDFYADHIIVDRSRLYLLDLDLYCWGTPALDVGNFLGHLIEQSVRETGRPDALVDCRRALQARYTELAGEVTGSVRVYTILTLIRHIALSLQLPGRRPFTELLMNLGERLLDIEQVRLACPRWLCQLL